MLNKRLQALADLVPKGCIPLDVGTDHAFLPIYLVKNNICPKALASDISAGALEGAKANIKKYNVQNISIYLTDGLQNIPAEYDLIIISGMGAYNALHILDYKPLPNNILLSVNNNLDILRKTMNKKGYKIKEEKIVYEKNKYYDLILYEKGQEKLSKMQIKYGKSNDLAYLNYLYNTQKKIYSVTSFKKKLTMFYPLYKLHRLIEKKKAN